MIVSVQQLITNIFSLDYDIVSNNYVWDTDVVIGTNYMMCVQMLIVVDNGPSVNVSDEIIGDNNCFVSLYYCVFLALVVCFSL